MNAGGDAAEQIVRLSLEGAEVAARLTGNAAKNIAVLLASVLKQQKKTKGKARLSSMIRSGKELKVFSIQNRDLRKFTEQARKYGVLYCVLRDKGTKDPAAQVDIITRAEDASKIQRIVDRFEFGKVEKASIVSEVEKSKEKKARSQAGKTKGEIIMEEAVNEKMDPTKARAVKDPLSGQGSVNKSGNRDAGDDRGRRPSVRAKMKDLEKKKSAGPVKQEKKDKKMPGRTVFKKMTGKKKRRKAR